MDLLLSTSTNQSLSGKLNFLLGSLRGYPTDWQSLDKLLGTEIKKQVAAGNLVTLSFPITNLPAEYFRSFHKTALTRFKDRSWYMGVNTSRTEYLITTPPVQTNDWLRLLAEVRSAH